MTEDLATFPGWPALLGRLTDGGSLTAAEARATLGEVLSGRATDAQIAATIVALRMRGETIQELVGFRDGMLDVSTPLDVPDGAVDIVGMGGSGARRSAAFNVSTIACFVAAAAGSVVCKHGNRKASSTSGSFDLLEALGVAIDITPHTLEVAMRELGIGFAFARTFHPAMRHVAAVRSELGVPSVFNVLGPIANPGRVHHQVLGVADPMLAPRIADVLAASGARYSLVVTGDDNTDEFSVTGPSQVIEVREGQTRLFTLDATTYGIARADREAVVGGDANDNARLTTAILDGDDRGPHRDMVVLNAAAAVLITGVAGDFDEAIQRAASAIDGGKARQLLDDYVAFTHKASA